MAEVGTVATVTAPVGGGAGGDGGAGTGTDVVEVPGQGEGGEGEGGEGGEGEGGEGGEEEPSGDEGGEGGEEEGLLDDIDADGRKTDAKTRKEIAELKKTNPEMGKKWADDHFHRKAFEAEFPGGVREARQTKAILESVGGEEGLTELQTSKESYETEIRQFRDGDPTLLKELQSSNPPAFVTSVRNSLELLASLDMKQFDEAIIPAMATRMENSGIFNASDSVLALIKEGKGQEAYDLMAKVVGWMRGAKDHAKKLLDTKNARDPEKEAVAREREDVQKERAKIYTEAITADVNRMNAGPMARLTSEFFKSTKLSENGRAEFKEKLTQRVYKEMGKDAAYLRAAKALRAKGDRTRHAQFVHEKFREVLPEEFRKLRNERYPHLAKAKTGAPAPKPKTPANKSAAPQVPAPKAVAGKVYERKDVDIDKTPDVFLITGKAYLKGTQTLVPYNR